MKSPLIPLLLSLFLHASVPLVAQQPEDAATIVRKADERMRGKTSMQFILADEPTANLDSQSATNLPDMMAQLNRDEGMTFIFSTHDARVIERARRVITLVDGRIASDTARVDVAH